MLQAMCIKTHEVQFVVTCSVEVADIVKLVIVLTFVTCYSSKWYCCLINVEITVLQLDRRGDLWYSIESLTQQIQTKLIKKIYYIFFQQHGYQWRTHYNSLKFKRDRSLSTRIDYFLFSFMRKWGHLLEKFTLSFLSHALCPPPRHNQRKSW